MFAPPLAESLTTTAPKPTNKLAPHRSAFVAQFGGDAALVQRRVDQGRFHRDRSEANIDPQEEDARRLDSQGQIALREGARPSWYFSKISIFPPSQRSSSLPLRLQAKFAIGAVNDPLEQEADRVADQVMRMPDPNLSVTSARPQLSRKCAACKEEKKAKMWQTKAAKSNKAVGEAPPSCIRCS